MTLRARAAGTREPAGEYARARHHHLLLANPALKGNVKVCEVLREKIDRCIFSGFFGTLARYTTQYPAAFPSGGYLWLFIFSIIIPV